MESVEQTQLDRPHIFAVNSSAEFLDVLRDLFQEEDYNVTTTNFVPQTFAQIAVLRPSVVIIDLVPGERTGWALIEELGCNLTTRHIPLIIVSTNASVLAQAAATFGDQLTRYLRKPLDLDALLTEVRELIGRA